MMNVIQMPSAAMECPVRRFERQEPAVRTDAVYVLHTSIDETPAAVRVAGEFARAWGVPLTLVHCRTVSYRLPADAPGGISPLETEGFINRLRAEHSDVRVRVYLCRNERQAIPLAFKPHSLIVIAGRRSWWPRPSERWRRMLEESGHYVIGVDPQSLQPSLSPEAKSLRLRTNSHA